MTMRERILEISKKHNLSHLGSCVSMVEILEAIYKVKKPNEPLVLSNGHAGLALYCALEKYEGKNAEELFEKHGVHPNRDEENGIWCSTGSLGMGVTIAVGMALADRTRDVYCTISDGECAEGSIWESFRIAQEQQLTNLKIYLNMNGWSAYRETNKDLLHLDFLNSSLVNVFQTNSDINDDIKGLDSHYKTL